MSDYGDDYSDEEDYDPWLYIEEDVHPADDLAEHAIASPPPPNYADDDADDFDLFNYWYDIEEASDGDDADNTTTSEIAKSGGKRKRSGTAGQTKKRRKISESHGADAEPSLSPVPTVLFKSQSDRDEYRKKNAKLLDETTEPYALVLGDEVRRASITGSSDSAPKKSHGDSSESGIDAGALMAALQNRLGAEGAPQGLDPSVLLQYAMRMMAGEDESDDIAGELAEELLDRDDDDPAAGGIASFLSQQRGDAEEDDEWEEMEEDEEVTETSAASLHQALESPAPHSTHQFPPTPSSTDTSTSTHEKEQPPSKKHSRKPLKTTRIVQKEETDQGNLKKRKVDEDDAEESTSAFRTKRIARSYDAPTAASQARASSSTTRMSRNGRMKRG